jgi:hypothetical protein
MPPRLPARAAPSTAPRPSLTAASVGGCAVLALAVCLAAPNARGQAAAPAAAAASPAASSKVTRPLWAELKAEQQEALEPLAPHWGGLSEAQKRKWIALSRNYAAMTPEGQSTLHSRMSDWASLSFQQRAQARLNFAEIQRLAADERKAKWEAYQALSDDERARLVERAGLPRSLGAAVAVQPVPARKLAPIPAVAPATQHTPRIQLAPPAPPPVNTGPPVAAEAQVPPPEASPSAQ